MVQRKALEWRHGFIIFQVGVAVPSPPPLHFGEHIDHNQSGLWVVL
jgi:hypothetical protein